MILASAIRQVRGLGDNKFEVVTSLRTFIFRADREGTSLFQPLLFCIFQSFISYSICSRRLSVCFCNSDHLICCLASFFYPPFLPFSSLPFLFCLSLIVISISKFRNVTLIFQLAPQIHFSLLFFCLSRYTPIYTHTHIQNINNFINALCAEGVRCRIIFQQQAWLLEEQQEFSFRH